MTDGSVDSVLLYGQDGRLIYPAAISPPSAVEAQSPEWETSPPTRGEVHKRQSDHPRQRRTVTSPPSPAMSRSSRERCRLRFDVCVRVGIRVPRRPSFWISSSGLVFTMLSMFKGGSSPADALLMAVQITPASDPRRLKAAEALRGMLIGYESSALPSTQRFFLMKELKARQSSRTAHLVRDAGGGRTRGPSRGIRHHAVIRHDAPTRRIEGRLDARISERKRRRFVANIRLSKNEHRETS